MELKTREILTVVFLGALMVAAIVVFLALVDYLGWVQ